MTESTEITIVPDHEIHVMARNPQELAEAQRQLVDWAGQRLQRAVADLEEASANLETARLRKWKISSWQSLVSRRKALVTFYEKVKAALEAGYCIIPPFPVGLFAIRTAKAAPRSQPSRSSWPAHHEQSAERLPAGSGDYRSPEPETIHSHNLKAKNQFPASDAPEDQHRMVDLFSARDWQEVDFPFRMAKMETVEAVSQAMAMKLFDQLGCLPAAMAKSDPIVVGQLVDPRPGRQPLTFHIAWWLDTKDI